MEPRNSLEALDNLVHCKSETRCKECHHKNVCTLERDYNIIKSDLEQKEQLEKENEELTEMLQLSTEYIAGFERVKADLMIENKELKQDIEDTIADYQDAARLMFKYMKIIEIIKNKDVDVHELLMCETVEEFNSYYTEPSQLTQEEYNLIMEGILECTRS